MMGKVNVQMWKKADRVSNRLEMLLGFQIQFESDFCSYYCLLSCAVKFQRRIQ